MSSNNLSTNKAELLAALLQSFQDILKTAESISLEKFQEEKNGKWSIGGNLEHLILSNRGIISCLARPKEFFQQFGQVLRPKLDSPTLYEKYKSGLAKTKVKAPPVYSPTPNEPKSKEELIATWKMMIVKIEERFDVNWTEKELDTHCLLHPVLGRLTMREMLYFMTFHNYHHLKAMDLIS